MNPLEDSVKQLTDSTLANKLLMITTTPTGFSRRYRDILLREAAKRLKMYEGLREGHSGTPIQFK